MAKPKFLYHGSMTKIRGELKPRKAGGVGEEKYKMNAVYASQSRDCALVFALPIVPDKKTGKMSWHGLPLTAEGKPRIVIEEGRLDTSKPMYLYKVPADSFKRIDKYEWASEKPVKPVECIKVDPNEYKHWVVKAPKPNKRA